MRKVSVMMELPGDGVSGRCAQEAGADRWKGKDKTEGVAGYFHRFVFTLQTKIQVIFISNYAEIVAPV